MGEVAPKEYIIFEDPIIENICMQRFSSDGIGVTAGDLASVDDTTFRYYFIATIADASSVVKFNEFRYFTNVTNFYSFTAYTSLTEITPPDSIRTYYNYCLRNTQVEHFEVNSGVTDIPNFTFRACLSLKEIIIPSTLQTLGGNATFYGSTALIYVAFHSTTPPTISGGTNLFQNANNCKIYVPYSADHSILSAYQSATVWANYSSRIQELNPDGTVPNS